MPANCDSTLSKSVVEAITQNRHKRIRHHQLNLIGQFIKSRQLVEADQLQRVTVIAISLFLLTTSLFYLRVSELNSCEIPEPTGSTIRCYVYENASRNLRESPDPSKVCAHPGTWHVQRSESETLDLCWLAITLRGLPLEVRELRSLYVYL